MNRSPDLIQLEDQRLNLIKSSPLLNHFSSNLTHWELLILIYRLDGDPKYGLNDYIDSLRTLSQTRLTLHNFIKEKIKENLLEVVPSDKKSRKTLSLSPALATELQQVLAQIWEN